MSAPTTTSPAPSAPASGFSPLRNTTKQLFDQAKQNSYVQYGVSRLASLSSQLPASLVAPVTKYSGPVGEFLDRSVSSVDNGLSLALTSATQLSEKATNLANTATVKTQNNISLIRSRLAAERSARANQVIEAANKISTVTLQVVETSPVLKNTLETTQATVQRALQIASQQWKTALTTGAHTLDVVLPEASDKDNTEASTNQPGNDNTTTDPSLTSLTSTVSRRVRARVSAVVKSSKAQINVAQNNLITRITATYTLTNTQLQSLLSNPQLTESVKRFAPLASNVQQQLNASVEKFNERKTYILTKVNEIKSPLTHAVVDFGNQVKTNGVSETVLKQWREAVNNSPKVTAYVTTTVSDVKGLVYGKVQFAIEWSRETAKHLPLPEYIANSFISTQPAQTA